MDNSTLQKLILAQLEEITKIVRDVDTRLTKLETSSDLHQDNREKQERVVSKELQQIETRLENLEKFRMKLVIGAGALALFVSVSWRLVETFLVPFLT